MRINLVSKKSFQFPAFENKTITEDLEYSTPSFQHRRMENDHEKFKRFIGGVMGSVWLLAICFAASAAETPPPVGWWSLGAMTAPAWDGKTLSFHSDQGNLTITPLSDDVVRVRLTTAKAFGRDHSYAVINRDLGRAGAKADIGTSSTTLATASLKVIIQHDPLRIEFQNAAGESLDADDPERGVAFAGGSFRAAKRLRNDEHVYGFGEKNGRLDKRGWQLGGYNYAMWNSDTYQYDSSTDPTYADIPFFMVVRAGQAHGIFLDNTWRSTFDVGRERQDLLTFGADGGDLDYYFINGPQPKAVIERYTALTGRTPLPPRWALGYNQCRYSYYPDARVRKLAEDFRSKNIPCDVIWLDIDFQDNYKPFTWDYERFPNPKKLITDLGAQGFHTVCIVDAHPKVEKGYEVYDSGMAGDDFVKRADGTVYEGPVWPSLAAHNPGPSVFPDFSRPVTREWWGEELKGLVDVGVAGIWNDMNEPSVFVPPTGTMPLDVIHDNDGQPTTHREIHNVYGQLMSRATFEGLGKLRPNDRPFVLSRATYAGGQRYAAIWPGDNTADWSALRQAVSTLLGMGVSGFSFVGSDIGGYAHGPTPELFTRWLQVGVFSPFMRVHAETGSPDKEPWSFGREREAINKRTIELRYELLPYIYNVMQQAGETGVPAMRPLFLEYPMEEAAASLDDEFLFGSDLLVAPILREGETERAVYLPKGDWYDYWTGKFYTGGTNIHVPIRTDSFPIFVRGGAFIFQQPIVQNTGRMTGNPLAVLVAAANESEASLYEDDGASLDYRNGNYLKRHFHQTREQNAVTVAISAPEGAYRPAKRDLILQVWADHAPSSVLAGPGPGQKLPHLEPPALAKAPRGWSYAGGMITVKDNDSFTATQFTIH
jgi:alpha-glucosidase